MSVLNEIFICKTENFDKLFLIKDFDNVKSIVINGPRDYNDQIIQQIIKFKKVERLHIASFHNNNLSEIANLQSLTHFTNDLVIINDHFYISKNTKNAILFVSNKTNVDKVITMLSCNTKNITIFVINGIFSKIYDNLPFNCTNVRIIILSIDSYENMFIKHKNFKLLNLPVTLQKIDIIFKQLASSIEYTNIITNEDEKKRCLIENKFSKEFKIPFNCKLNVVLL